MKIFVMEKFLDRWDNVTIEIRRTKSAEAEPHGWYNSFILSEKGQVINRNERFILTDELRYKLKSTPIR